MGRRRTQRMMGVGGAIVGLLALAGCIVLPPPAPAPAPVPSVASPSPSAPPAPSASQGPSTAPTPAPSTQPAASTPPDGECEASDAAMAGIIEATGGLDVALPGSMSGASDWDAADAVIADLRARHDAWVAATSDPGLLEAGAALDAEIEEAAGVVSRRDESEIAALGMLPYTLPIILAAASVVEPCDLS